MKYFILNPFKKAMLTALAVLTVSAFIMPEVQAQLPNLLNSGKRSKRSVNTPTTITAITMDFDIENNEATLLGDVVVDDPDIKIECNRMKIFLEDKKADDKKNDKKDDNSKNSAAQKEQKAPADKTPVKPAVEKKSSEADADKTAAKPVAPKAAASADKSQSNAGKNDSKEDDSLGGGKQLVKIECVGDVIITRKPAEGESRDQEQRATAGKAIYYFKDSIIELLDKPVVYADNKKITGRAITINLEQGGRMKLTLGKIEDYAETPLLDMGK